MLILYKNDRNVRFVLFTKTSIVFPKIQHMFFYTVSISYHHTESDVQIWVDTLHAVRLTTISKHPADDDTVTETWFTQHDFSNCLQGGWDQQWYKTTCLFSFIKLQVKQQSWIRYWNCSSFWIHSTTKIQTETIHGHCIVTIYASDGQEL